MHDFTGLARFDNQAYSGSLPFPGQMAIDRRYRQKHRNRRQALRKVPITENQQVLPGGNGFIRADTQGVKRGFKIAGTPARHKANRQGAGFEILDVKTANLFQILVRQKRITEFQQPGMLGNFRQDIGRISDKGHQRHH